MKRSYLALATALMLAGCGKVAPLTPETGQELPPRPALAKQAPDAETLLQLPPSAAPERVDELLKKGEPRKPDRFDLPPPAGADSPPPPAAEGEDKPQ